MISGLAALGALAGLVASIMLIGVCIVASGSWWPLTSLLVVALIVWCLPWEVWRSRRGVRR